MDDDAVTRLQALLPAGVELLENLTSAAWVEERLRSVPRRGQVASFMPAGYDGYARIPHRSEGQPICSSLSPDQCGLLADVLLRHSSPPYASWFCLWEGFDIGKEGSLLVLEPHNPFLRALQRFQMRRSMARSAREDGRRQRELARIPRVSLRTSESYFLFSGPIDLVPTFTQSLAHSPNLWWPEDYAWFVATDIDSYSTYVGGSNELRASLTEQPGLDVVPASLDDPLDPGPIGRA